MHKRRNIGLDFARVAAMATVWISHSSMFSIGLNPKFMEFAPIVGLEIFFALSGFLVGKALIGTVTANDVSAAMKRFYINRLLRALPLYYLVLIVTSILFDTRIPVSNFLFLQNFRPEDLGFFPPSWSLPIEIWFYFLIPPVFLMLYRLFCRKYDEEKSVFASIGVLCLLPLVLRTLHILLNDPQWDMGVRKRVLLRMDAPMLGVFFASLKLYKPECYKKIAQNPITAITSVAGILGLYGWYYLYLAEGGVFNHSALGKILIFTGLPILCCLLVVWLENVSLFEKLRGTVVEKAICGLSSLGYSVYLVHFAVFLLIGPYFEGTRFIVSWMGFGLAVIVSIAVSVASYLLVERPMEKLKNKVIVKL